MVAVTTVLVLVIAVAMAIGLGARRELIRQLGALRRTIRRLATGNTSARTELGRARGAVGKLARAIDDFAESLGRASRRHVLALDSLGEAICGFDVRGVSTFANPAAARMLGVGVKDLAGRPLHELLHPGRSAHSAQECPLYAALRDGVVHRLDGELFARADGSSFAVEFVATPIHERGQVVGAVAVFRDLTERRRAEEEIQQQREALMQRDSIATITPLLAGIAHELNDPLSVVLGQARLLALERPESADADRARRIVDAAERCAHIVKNFRALARHESPERQRLELDDVVTEAVDLLAYRLRIDSVEVVLDLAGGLPPVWADQYQLQQVVVNLLSNANHALRKVPAPRRVTVGTWFDAPASRVVLEVVDTGPGIPAEIQDRIFEPFFTTRAPGQAHGLGLSLCRDIVEDHRGTIAVESKVGQGARFRVELPAYDEPAAPAAGTSRVEDVVTLPLTGRVLVVDDEPEMIYLLSEVLRRDGHEVDGAQSGREALKRLEEHQYDVILSDVRMPGVDGPALYAELERRDPSLLRRFVFVTGDAVNEETRDFLETCGAQCISKPFHYADLKRLVQRVLNQE